MMIKHAEEIVVELDSGKQCSVDVVIFVLHDENYGADADGNRGEPRSFIDDVEYNTPDKTDCGQFLSLEQKKEIKTKIDQIIDRMIF